MIMLIWQTEFGEKVYGSQGFSGGIQNEWFFATLRGLVVWRLVGCFHEKSGKRMHGRWRNERSKGKAETKTRPPTKDLDHALHASSALLLLLQLSFFRLGSETNESENLLHSGCPRQNYNTRKDTFSKGIKKRLRFFFFSCFLKLQSIATLQFALLWSSFFTIFNSLRV